MTTQALAAARAICDAFCINDVKHAQDIAAIISAHFPAPSGSALMALEELSIRCPHADERAEGGISDYGRNSDDMVRDYVATAKSDLGDFVRSVLDDLRKGAVAENHEAALAGALKDAVNWCNPVSRPPGISLPEWFEPASAILARYREATGK